ncbi:single-stranded DNA-binding protein [Microbacterium sp.]|uniref:single-stranded DNA-binding protein n=1 Tax=Microbacterium sp. TaxID=51671 RepID=UPI003A8F3D0C
MTIRNDTVVIAGNIGNDPSRSDPHGQARHQLPRGSTPGYFDQRTGAGSRGHQLVRDLGLRNIADHAKASLRRGDPVIVVGRMKVREWEANGRRASTSRSTRMPSARPQQGTSASSVGPRLALGALCSGRRGTGVDRVGMPKAADARRGRDARRAQRAEREAGC